MNFFTMLLSDPVVLAAFIGLAILLGICGFYVYYFIKKVSEDKGE